MAYCTVDDIKEYSNITSFTTTTRPTLLAVEDMIDTHGGVINAQLARLDIDQPTVVTTAGYKYLKLLNIYCVLADVILTNKGESETVTAYRTLCSNMMNAIADNPDLIQPNSFVDGGTGHSVRPDIVYKWQETQW